ncbi:MAG: phosphoribosylformimino-5-aminoimidazole carboxamide ribotide isomerase [Fibrobacter sp.]|nr:phosphoribosylformimino-5-aminoimidazole carboxamide ribotide isomerase [Fibrobacter sp.]
MKFRPCIDLHAGKVKQIVGSTLKDDGQEPLTNFQTDLSPAYFAGLYKKENLYGGHVIMLGKGNESAALDALKAFPGGFHIGGGITPDNAHLYLDAGASHVIVTSYVFKDGMVHWDRLEHLMKSVGKEKLVLDLSCKKKNGVYYVVTDRWQNFTDISISSQTFDKLSSFCDEFLIHAADVEGMCKGIDVELIELLSRSISLPTTYAGGVRSIEDLVQLERIGMGRIDVTVGSALDIFGGNLSFRSVVDWCRTVG